MSLLSLLRDTSPPPDDTRTLEEILAEFELIDAERARAADAEAALLQRWLSAFRRWQELTRA